jgi:uncharacterized protein (TIGR03032 family)
MAAAKARSEDLWAQHHTTFRDPHQIVSLWGAASDVDPLLLAHRVRGAWWEVLERTGLTLFVTREYEHFVLSGLAVDSKHNCLHIASTRNPNVVFTFAPCSGHVGLSDSKKNRGQLLPVQAHYLPGCVYTHDLAFIGGRLHANAVGMNAIVRLADNGGFSPVWWPRSIDAATGPRFDRNYIQMNSIAPGETIEESFFSASAEGPSRRRPGHLNWAVDRRGVIFSGRTREVVGRGLTRPHSARLRAGEVWVDNSGYGQVGRIVAGQFEPILRLPGWTRGLFFHGDLAFVATSRVIPKYHRYAPGLDPDRCECALHAIDVRKGSLLGSMVWPAGNQIFAIEGLPAEVTPGFPFSADSARNPKRRVELFFRGMSK